MRQKLLALLVFLVILNLAGWQACMAPMGDTECPDYAVTEDNELIIASYEVIPYYVSEFGDEETEFSFSNLPDQTIPYNRLAITLGAEFSLNEKRVNWLNFNLSKPLYACSFQADGIVGKLTSLTITSDFEYDRDHPAGSDLSEVFDVYVTYFGESGLYTTKPLDDFLSEEPSVITRLYLIPASAPDINSKHQFTVSYTLDSASSQYSFTTREITITYLSD